MIWALVAIMAALSFAGAALVLKAPRGTWEAIAAALILGGAGYAVQGRPDESGAPKQSREPISADSSAIVETRLKMTNKGIPPNNQWVVIADGLARNGRYADAASVLRGAIEKDPKNSDAWLAMANALMAHADGMLTPASLYAYRRAAKADPDSPGPPFFLGLAFLQDGRVAEARDLWADMLARGRKDAPWREPLANQLERIDAFLSATGKASMEPTPSRP